MILPRLGRRARPRPPFLPEALEPSDEPVPVWFWATAVLCLAASATAYLTRSPAVEWAWVPAFAPSFLLLPWRGWRGAAAAGGAGALVVAVAGHAGLGIVPWSAVGTVVFASVGMATAEALRRRRWLSALRDPATGLPSRRLTEVMLQHEVAAARRGRRLSIVLMAVEEPHTSAIPLRPGAAPAGDDAAPAALGAAPDRERDDEDGDGDGVPLTRRIGGIIRKEARSMDVLGRFGHDLLLAVLPSEDSEGAMAFARRMSDAARSLSSPYGAFPIVSAGVASFERTTSGEAELLEHAATALAEARKGGGGRIFYHGREGLLEATGETGPGKAVSYP